MEKRLITQVKLYILRLNSIFANAEQANIVLISPELSHLQGYYFRHFAESSHLVDYNPADYEVNQGCTYDGAHGIIEEWVNMEDLEKIKTAFAGNGWID